MKPWTKKLLDLAFPVATVVVLVCVWAIAAAAVGKPLILPTPIATCKAFGELLGSAEFWAGFGMTFVRACLAYIIACAIAFIAAYFSRNRNVRRALYPVMSILRAVPTMAVIFLFLIWVKARWSPVWVAVTVLLPTMYTGFTDAFDLRGNELEEMSKVYRVPWKKRFLQMTLPLSVPPLISSLSFLSLGLKLVVAAEALAMTATSLGALLYQANLAFETARLLAVSLAAVIAGFIIDGLTFVIGRAVKWM